MAKKKAETKPEVQEPEASEAELPHKTPAMSPGSYSTIAVIGPKLNPHVRPVGGTEQVSTTPIRQSYEEIQASATGAGVDKWREIDRSRAKLGELYRDLQEDERYAPEYKAKRAWDEYERTKAKVEELAPVAREEMLTSAEVHDRLSISVPEQQGLVTKDTDKLLLSAHERARIEGLLKPKTITTNKGKKVEYEPDPYEVLSCQYEHGLKEGGPSGGATVRAVVQVARDRELEIDRIVDAHRKPRHREHLDRVNRAWMQAQMVYRSVPQPPFPHPEQLAQEPARVGTYGHGTAKRFAAQNKGVMFSGRKNRHW